jgi:hypothetical protein
MCAKHFFLFLQPQYAWESHTQTTRNSSAVPVAAVAFSRSENVSGRKFHDRMAIGWKTHAQSRVFVAFRQNTLYIGKADTFNCENSTRVTFDDKSTNIR